MAHDVFISYAAEDKLTADAVCASLEQRGIRCWIAPRDILPGQDYGEAIVEALGRVRAFVLIFSTHANASAHVKNEVERVANSGLPIIPLRTEDVDPSGSLALHLSRRHWLDALTPPLEQHIETLAQALTLFLNAEPRASSAMPPAEPRATSAGPLTGGTRVIPRVPRSVLFGLAAIVLLALAFFAGRSVSPRPAPAPTPASEAAAVPETAPAPDSPPVATAPTHSARSKTVVGDPKAAVKVTLNGGAVYYFEALHNYWDVAQGSAEVSVPTYDIRQVELDWRKCAPYAYITVTQKNGQRVEGEYPPGCKLSGTQGGYDTTMDMDVVAKVEYRD